MAVAQVVASEPLERCQQLLQDLRVDGSFTSGGNLKKCGHPVVLAHLQCVPEPSSVVLLFGFVGVLRRRRRATKGEAAASRETADRRCPTRISVVRFFSRTSGCRLRLGQQRG